MFTGNLDFGSIPQENCIKRLYKADEGFSGSNTEGVVSLKVGLNEESFSRIF